MEWLVVCLALCTLFILLLISLTLKAMMKKNVRFNFTQKELLERCRHNAKVYMKFYNYYRAKNEDERTGRVIDFKTQEVLDEGEVKKKDDKIVF